MSLKAFHIFFIAVSVLCTLGFGVWGVNAYFQYAEVDNLALGLLSFGVAGTLVLYGVRFLRKLKGVGGYL